MFTLFTWMLLFVLGLAIYFAPVFLYRHMYEGFSDSKLKEIMQSHVTGTPELTPDRHMIGAETTSSTPSPSNQPERISDVLSQGVAFQGTVPTLPRKVETVPANSADGLNSSCIPPVIPKTITKIKYVKEPNTCPDMSQYIRKDSIPCWSCKLG